MFMLNEMEEHNSYQPLSLVAQLVKDITNIAEQMRLLDQKFVELDPANKTEVEKFNIEELKLWDSYREKSNTLMELKKKIRNLDLKHKKSPGYRPYSSDIQVVFPPVMHGAIREENVEIKGWEIHENEIKIDFQSPLGEGTYASVYKGKCRGKHVAVKILKGDLSREALQEFKHEVSISSKLRHENLLLFMGICTDGGQLKILTELMPRGNLSSLLRTEKLSMTRKMLIAQDVALGMCWLHKQGIYHFDLKPPNLFIGDNWVVKVADFGISQFKDNITAIGGTLNYLAPEVLTGDQKTEMLNKVDVYAFGMILWEILTEQTPWHKQLRSIPEFVRNVGAEGKRLPIPEDCPPLLHKLITDCWSQHPESRPTFEYIVEANIFPQIIIESCIASDPDGQAFWKRHFDNAIQVPWPRFLNGFATYFNIQLPRSHEVDPKLTCLKMAMGDGATVSAEQFGNSIAWYGPLRRGQAQAFLDRVYNIWSFEGFFGEFGREEAERKLVDEKPGSLLIRLSSIPGHFAISARTKAGVFKHFKVMYANETFQFDDERPCTSLEQVITIVKKANKLKYIAVGSKFKQNIVLKQQEDNRDPSSYTKIETKSKTKK